MSKLKPEFKKVAEALERAGHVVHLGPGTRVLQVGSSDGVSGDPLLPWIKQRSRWAYFLVEPRPKQFLLLNERHAGRRHVTVHQACIVASDADAGEVTMYEYDNPHELPNWAQHVGSLDRQHLLDRNTRDKLKGIVIDISCWGETLSEVMREMRLHAPDVLIVDMCGSENLVILPLMQHARIVCYNYIEMSDDDTVIVTRLLAKNGFEKFYQGLYDVVWLRKLPRVAEVHVAIYPEDDAPPIPEQENEA